MVVYPVEQLKWHQAATALNEILVDLGNVIRAGAEEVANTDRRSGGVWAG
uniref:B229_C1_150 n=1 Tax=Mycobacterium leprae TaxID=1769 RepID=Q49852_MYCLR|nr:B229_C1_150 [Mycobacterium leprae]